MIVKKILRDFRVPRSFANEHISSLKKINPNLTVIDVGGGVRSWCNDTTHIADIFIVPGSRQELEKNKPNLKIFELDINQKDEWRPLLDHVSTYGKFDYSICTHTLEDIAYPNIVCDMLMKISKAGIIAVPSRFIENARFERQYAVKGYKGFFHHKWIYSIRYDVFTGYEKNSYWEFVSLDGLNKPDILRVSELCFMWENEFKYNFFHLGQCVGADNHYPRYGEIALQDDLD
jgi:hypothetical protein